MNHLQSKPKKGRKNEIIKMIEGVPGAHTTFFARSIAEERKRTKQWWRSIPFTFNINMLWYVDIEKRLVKNAERFSFWVSYLSSHLHFYPCRVNILLEICTHSDFTIPTFDAKQSALFIWFSPSTVSQCTMGCIRTIGLASQYNTCWEFVYVRCFLRYSHIQDTTKSAKDSNHT